jgi:predicted urease superfamily metal-dependent hydrolase
MSMTEYDNAEYEDGFPRLPMPAAVAKAAEQVGEAAAAIAKTADAATAILTRLDGWLQHLQEILP